MRFNFRLIALCLAAAALTGCAGGSGSFGSFGGGGDTSRPKAIYVGDFIFGDGVIADMSVTRSKRQLLAFSADLGKRAGAAPSGKQAAARNAMFAESLAGSKAG